MPRTPARLVRPFYESPIRPLVKKRDTTASGEERSDFLRADRLHSSGLGCPQASGATRCDSSLNPISTEETGLAESYALFERRYVEAFNWKDWLPLAGVAVGWGLNQCGQWFVFRRDERKAIGRALADLLEVRHRLLAIPKVVEAMSAKLGMPADAQTPLKVVFGALFPSDEGLAKRYEESVSLVAATNPVLGFRLRSQDVVGPFLHQLRALALRDGPQSVALLGTMENHMLSHLAPHLERLIRELAKRHGWRTWWETNRRLKQPFDAPEEFWEALKAAIPSPPPRPASGAASTQ
jgi:hypothetical protein